MDHPRVQTDVLTIHQMRLINWHRGENDYDSVAEHNSDTEDWLNLNGDLDNTNNDEINGKADDENELDIFDDSDFHDKLEVQGVLNIPQLICPVQ
jgi:hypothetical protein